jgi:hypothetical protein
MITSLEALIEVKGVRSTICLRGLPKCPRRVAGIIENPEAQTAEQE